MDGQVEAEANLLQKLESGGGSLAGALLLDKVQDFLAKLVGPVRSAFVRQQASQALSFESGLRLVKGGPRAAEQFGRRADGFSVDLNPTQHLVFDLEGVASIEEIVLQKKRVGDAVGMRVEGAGLAQRGELGIGRGGFHDRSLAML